MFRFYSFFFFFFSSRRRHTRYIGDWSSDVCSSDLVAACAFSIVAACAVVTAGAVRAVCGLRIRARSEERRVGKECRARWARYEEKKKEDRGVGVKREAG